MEYRVLCTDYVQYNGKIYAPLWFYNSICEIDPKTENVAVVGKCEDNKYRDGVLYGRVAIYKERIFFAPLKADKVAILDMKFQKLIMIDLSDFESQDESADKLKFWSTIVVGEYVYFFPLNSTYILKMHAETLECFRLSKWYDDLLTKRKIGFDSRELFFGEGFFEINDKYYLPSGAGNYVWKIDFSIDEFEPLEVNHCTELFYSAGEFEGKIALTINNESAKHIVLWDAHDNEIEDIEILEAALWNEPVQMGKDLLLLPKTPDSHILRISGLEHRCSVFSRLDDLLEMPDGKRDCTMAVKNIGSKISFIRVSDSQWFTFDWENDSLESTYFEITDEKFKSQIRSEEYDEFFEKACRERQLFDENFFPFKEFISRI